MGKLKKFEDSFTFKILKLFAPNASAIIKKTNERAMELDSCLSELKILIGENKANEFYDYLLLGPEGMGVHHSTESIINRLKFKIDAIKKGETK